MATITVRNVPDEAHKALQVLAREHGRSMEAEVRQLIREATETEESFGGSWFRVAEEFRSQYGGADLEFPRLPSRQALDFS